MMAPPKGFRNLAAVLAMVTWAGCTDAPTSPDALRQIAGGEAWLAVPVPSALPTVTTWSGFVYAESDARRQVESLGASARRARLEGRPAEGDVLELEAARIAARAADAIDPGVLVRGFAAADGWVRRVREGIDPAVHGAVWGSARVVEQTVALGRASLDSGDVRGATVHLAQASIRIHRHGPAAVALRALDRAEAALADLEVETTLARRATRFIRSARLELVDGDPARALRRALYALQLAGGV